MSSKEVPLRGVTGPTRSRVDGHIGEVGRGSTPVVLNKLLDKLGTIERLRFLT